MKSKEEIRAELYEYLETLIPLDHKIRGKIKKLILHHDEAESKKELASNIKINQIKNKLLSYKAKAVKIEKTPRVMGQIEALDLVLSLLNSDTD